MKTKTTILATLLVVVMAFQASAQIGFGIRAGAGLFTLEQKWHGFEAEMSLAPRINAGFFGEFHFSPEFSLQSALIFASKGGKEIVPDGAKSSESISILLYYIELPVNFLYNARLNDGVFKVGMGPYLGYGLSGKYKTSLKTFDIKFANTYESGGGLLTTYKPIDFGLNAVAGYEFGNGLSVFLNAQLGLANYYLPDPSDSDPKSTPDNSMKNMGFYLSVGYKF